ncbi:MAG: DUF1592 domain-containing protein, partial [Deltaproteobacteria bacterium]|nr:DUF1592 domain-containing protein [Deltaproteobacteria bacterium]
MRRWTAAVLLLAAACSEPEDVPDEEDSPVPSPAPEPVWLSPTEHLVRASMAIRGLRPSIEDLARIEADPASLEPMVDAYLASDEFLATLRDLHAELYRVRVDLEPPFPALGPLAGYTGAEIHEATSEEVLRLVAHIVTNDRPYTEIVTADYLVANAPLAAIYGLAYDPAGDEWQETHWVDGRESAGVLSSSEIFRRQPSAGNNFQRHRANFVADTFLCEDFASREVTIRGDLDLSDPETVAAALASDPSCVACHQALDPLAAAFWGFKQHLDESPVELAMELGCHVPPSADPDAVETPFDQRFEDYCYPLRFYTPLHETMYREFSLPEPAYYGTPFTGLAELGGLIAEDPRFHQCSVRHFVGWFQQMDEDELPFDEILARTEAFEASGFDARQLVRDIVLDDAFRIAGPPAGAPDTELFAAPVQVVRPE